MYDQKVVIAAIFVAMFVLWGVISVMGVKLISKRMLKKFDDIVKKKI